MCWRLIIEEFGLKLKYIKVENNVLSNAFIALILFTIKRYSTYLSTMDTMTMVCLIVLIQFVITILPNHRKMMLNYNKI